MASFNPAALGGFLGGIANIFFQKKALDRDKAVAKIQERRAQAENLRQRRQQIRQSLIARSQIENAAAQTGTQQTSSATSAVASVQNLAATNITQLRSNQITSGIINSELRKANQYRFTGEALQGVGQGVTNLFGG